MVRLFFGKNKKIKTSSTSIAKKSLNPSSLQRGKQVSVEKNQNIHNNSALSVFQKTIPY